MRTPTDASPEDVAAYNKRRQQLRNLGIEPPPDIYGTDSDYDWRADPFWSGRAEFPEGDERNQRFEH